MPWYIRRSVRVGPVRLNLSRRGIGYSVGVRGARIGRSATGRRYVAGGRGMLRYYQTLGHAEGAAPHATPHAAQRPPMAPATPPPSLASSSASSSASSPEPVATYRPLVTVPTGLMGWALVACGVAYVLALVLAFAGATGAGADVVIGVNVGLVVLAWRNYWTLAGLVSWRRLGTWARIGLALVYLLGWVTPGIVLVRLAILAHRAHQAELEAMPERIAELERDLGIGQPPADSEHSV